MVLIVYTVYCEKRINIKNSTKTCHDLSIFSMYTTIIPWYFQKYVGVQVEGLRMCLQCDTLQTAAPENKKIIKSATAMLH